MEGQQHQQQLQVVRPLKIGVLALQGAFLEHINLLARLENPPQTVEVRNPSTLHSFRKDYLAAAGCYLQLPAAAATCCCCCDWRRRSMNMTSFFFIGRFVRKPSWMTRIWTR